MYYSLNGTLIFSDVQTAAVECGGVGYKCFITLNTRRKLPPVGGRVLLYTHLTVREDALDLYGFADLSELECFRLITTVNGLGPKIGLSILSAFTPDQIALFVATGDAKSLTQASGVGAKLAQRMVLELKDKMGSIGGGELPGLEAAGAVSASAGASEAVSALVALGYSQSEATLAVGKLDSSLPVEELIRQALKSLVKKH